MVKCKDCGYLAVRDEYNNQICEATEFTREHGLHKSSKGITTTAKLLCFTNSASFPEGSIHTAETRAAKANLMEQANEQLNTEIECDQFLQWIPGRSPKEHEEMSFVEMIDARTRQWHEEEVKRGQDARTDLRRTTYIVAAIGFVASIIAAILTVYFAGPGR